MFWCELVAQGIGGATIEEAQARLSYAESRTWLRYLQAHGPLNVGFRLERRLEAGFAMLAALIVNRSGGDHGRAVSMREFMDRGPPVEEEELTPEVFMRIVTKGR